MHSQVSQNPQLILCHGLTSHHKVYIQCTYGPTLEYVYKMQKITESICCLCSCDDPPLERRAVGQFTPHSCDYLVEIRAQNLNLRRVVDSIMRSQQW